MDRAPELGFRNHHSSIARPHSHRTSSRRAAVRSDGNDREEFLSVEDARQTLRLVTLLTFVGGALLALRWWVDPRFVISSIYLGGWFIGVGTLVAVYAALSVDR